MIRVYCRHPTIFNAHEEEEVDYVDKTLKNYLLKKLSDTVYDEISLEDLEELIESDKGTAKHEYKIDCCIFKKSELERMVELIEMIVYNTYDNSDYDELKIMLNRIKENL